MRSAAIALLCLTVAASATPPIYRPEITGGAVGGTRATLAMTHNEGPGAKDWSGQGNDGTINGATYANALDGYYYNGNDWIDIEHSGTDAIEITGTKTLSMWFYCDNIALVNGLIHLANPCCELTDFLAIGSSGSILYISADDDTAGTRTTSTLLSATWYHLVVGKTTGDISAVYINGESDSNAAGSFWAVSEDGRIGSINAATDRFQTGYVTDVMLFDRALTQAEAKKLYQQGKAEGK